MEYFIIDNNGQQAGPFSLDQLAQKAITPETLVWTQGMKDWTPAWKVAELKNVLEAAEAIRDNAATQQQADANAYTTDSNSVPPNYQQNQTFQQAQQQAYQQGFQHGAAMNQGNTYQGGNGYQNGGYEGNGGYQSEQPQKQKSSKMLWKVIFGLIIFIILMLAVTNPGADAHKEKVRTEVGKAIEKATATTDNNFFSQAMRSVAKMMADNVMGEAMDQLFQYHNYIICSKGTVEFNGKEHTISFGILGKVYTMNADDMVKALEDGDNLRIEESSSTSSSDNTSSSDDQNAINGSSSSSDDENATSSNDNQDDGFGSSVQKKLEDKANQALDKAADKVSKKVEEKINQKLNEATDSSKIEKIIDKILDLI